MINFNHDKTTVADACNIDSKNYTEFQKQIYSIYFNTMMTHENPSKFIEKLEHIILKDVENRLRIFLFSFYCAAADKFNKIMEEVNADGKG